MKTTKLIVTDWFGLPRPDEEWPGGWMVGQEADDTFIDIAWLRDRVEEPKGFTKATPYERAFLAALIAKGLAAKRGWLYIRP